jgi:hypothetical protein
VHKVERGRKARKEKEKKNRRKGKERKKEQTGICVIEGGSSNRTTQSHQETQEEERRVMLHQQMLECTRGGEQEGYPATAGWSYGKLHVFQRPISTDLKTHIAIVKKKRKRKKNYIALFKRV